MYLCPLIAATVGILQPYSEIQRSWKLLQNTSAFFLSGWYISIMSSPAQNTLAKLLVRMIPLADISVVLMTSLSSWIISKLRVLTGALLRLIVDIPSLSTVFTMCGQEEEEHLL